MGAQRTRGPRRTIDTPLPYYEDDCGYSTPCWRFALAARNAGGYGLVRIEGRLQKAHRVAYMQVHGPIHPQAVLDHLCRQTDCINPAHLESVTKAENMRRSPHAKLGYADVDAIRTRLASGESRAGIAACFGIREASVRQIETGRIWSAPGGVV